MPFTLPLLHKPKKALRGQAFFCISGECGYCCATTLCQASTGEMFFSTASFAAFIATVA